MRHRIKKGIRILLITITLLLAGGICVFFRIRAGIYAAVNVRKLEDGFYYMEYQKDYGFDRFLEQGGAVSDLDVAKFVGKDLFKGLLYPRFLGGSFGCSTLSARNQEGGVMYGRNFDWMECTSMVVKSKQDTGKPDITTTTAVRLLLDKAADVNEAIHLLEQYDMHSSAGMMLHFSLSDKSGLIFIWPRGKSMGLGQNNPTPDMKC